MQRVNTHYARVDAVLDGYRDKIAADASGYRNHVYRTLNYYAKLSGTEDVPESVLIAASFHDIGIWTARTFDYIGPSVAEALLWLEANSLDGLAPEVRALIEHHHKVRRYSAAFDSHVEAYRRADLVDLSLGLRRFGVPRSFIATVKAAFPNAGFHRLLLRLAARRFLRHPLKPLPMLRW